MKNTLFILLTTILLSACTGSQTSNTSDALASNICKSLEQKTKINFDWSAYGFESKKELQTYVNSIKDTQEFNNLSIKIRDKIEKKCPNAIKSANLVPADLVNGILQ